MRMLLKDKTAVIYGAGGDVGAAVARAFAREGAKLFLSGRTRAKVNAVASEIAAAGGAVEAAEVDALDERAVDEYVAGVAKQTGAIDISFCAVGVSSALPRKTPLLETALEHFELPIRAYTRASFLTARAAARTMVERRSGVILTITATPSRLAIPHVGGGSAAYAAVTALSRTLSVELAPRGVRVVCLMPNALPETQTIRENFARFAATAGITPAEFLARIESTTHLGRLTTLRELADAAVFAASEHASGMTGTVLNLSGGGVAD